MSALTASRTSAAVSSLSSRSGSLTYSQNSFFDAPSSRNMNIATRIGGKRYFSASDTMDLPLVHSFSMRLEFCFTR